MFYSGFVLGMFHCILYCNHLVRQDMDVNEHERLALHLEKH